MQEIEVTVLQNNFLDLLDQQIHLDFNLISLSHPINDQSYPTENNTTSQWVWSDAHYMEPDPINQELTLDEQLEDIRSARIYQQKMLEHILVQSRHEQILINEEQLVQINIERKNSMATEPGSPLRKKKKIKKVVVQN